MFLDRQSETEEKMKQYVEQLTDRRVLLLNLTTDNFIPFFIKP